ncbi:MAG: hypothetical protein AAFS04_17540, partial [Cyanobacteria bacterium J06631_9]
LRHDPNALAIISSPVQSYRGDALSGSRVKEPENEQENTDDPVVEFKSVGLSILLSKIYKRARLQEGYVEQPSEE